MTVRHIESMIRMSEAHAKMHLRDFVTDDDLNMAIRVMLNSFISTQKYSVARELKKKFRVYLTYKKDSNESLLAVLQGLFREMVQYDFAIHSKPPELVEIKQSSFEAKGRQMEITDFRPFYKSLAFSSNGFTLDERNRVIRKNLDSSQYHLYGISK